MTSQHAIHEHPTGDARERLLAAMPVTERRLELRGVSTAVLEGGEGPPVVLLHGPPAHAAHWMRVIPDLAAAHHMIAPDLPGQGASRVTGRALDANRVLSWLGDLVEATCPSPPVLVGHALGGAIAARFSAQQGARVSGLVLVDALGLVPFAPAPDFGLAVNDFLAKPNERTHDDLWRYCAYNLYALRARMGDQWEPFRAYNVERVGTPSVRAAFGAMMEQFGGPPIPAADLSRIAVPTTLIWGRHDLATPLRVAEELSGRHGWTLHVIEDCGDDPPVEAPQAFLRALHTALDPKEES